MCSLPSDFSITTLWRHAFSRSQAQSSSSSSAAGVDTLTGVMCTFSPGVKAKALDRSSAAAEAQSCALLSIVGLVEVTGIVGCSGRAPDSARVVPFAARARGAGGAAAKVVVSTAGSKTCRGVACCLA